MVIPIAVINMNIDFLARLLSNSFFRLFIFLLFILNRLNYLLFFHGYLGSLYGRYRHSEPSVSSAIDQKRN